MTDGMIERVARLLCEQRGGDPNVVIQAGDATGNPIERTAWELHQDDARAVLSAMREPTEEMMRAKAVDDDGEKAEVDGYLDYLSADNIWRAMIDAAFEEGRNV